MASEIGEFIGNRAYRALLAEVYTTPKPGLVDRGDTGAHTDMNCQIFQKSTEAIVEDLAAMFAAGYSWEASPEKVFRTDRAPS